MYLLKLLNKVYNVSIWIALKYYAFVFSSNKLFLVGLVHCL